jgi:hypothetical protein
MAIQVFPTVPSPTSATLIALVIFPASRFFVRACAASTSFSEPTEPGVSASEADMPQLNVHTRAPNSSAHGAAQNTKFAGPLNSSQQTGAQTPRSRSTGNETKKRERAHKDTHGPHTGGFNVWHSFERKSPHRKDTNPGGAQTKPAPHKSAPRHVRPHCSLFRTPKNRFPLFFF